MSRRILWQCILFLGVLGISVAVILPMNIPGAAATSVIIFVILADVTVLVDRVKRIIRTNGEVNIICTLNENGLQEKTEYDEIRIFPFSLIQSYSVGKINIGEEENYFRVRFKKTYDEIYFTTNEVGRVEFFNFTEEFMKAVEQFNSSLPAGIVKIKELK